MIKDSQKQNGSAAVLIIVVLVIAIVGALAFVVWSNFIKPKTTTYTSQQTTAITTENMDPNEGYSIVQEWGVRFKNAAELNDTEVQQERLLSSDATPQVSYAFTTTRIKALGGACSSGTFSHTEILTRYADKPVATPDGELLNDSPIGGYYYVLGAPSASCTVIDSGGTLKQGATESLVELNDRAALKASIKTISLLE